MEEVNRHRRTVLQVQVGELHLWRLNQSSSPRKCRFHLGFSLGWRAVGEAGVTEGQADWGDLEAIADDRWNPGGFNDATG